jgi:hypothetical protein
MAVATTRIQPGDCHSHPGAHNACVTIWGHLSNMKQPMPDDDGAQALAQAVDLALLG